ncbi:MAG: hypothetical protein MZV70_45350 [Desulfobacterales bacterium]|nr:hypothetical protein [Desulfobacterales bacterium]
MRTRQNTQSDSWPWDIQHFWPRHHEVIPVALRPGLERGEVGACPGSVALRPADLPRRWAGRCSRRRSSRANWSSIGPII